MRFTYTGLSSPTREREVEPWRIIAQRRGWYLLGRDCESGEQRRFRLSRVRGQVTETGPAGAFEIPEHSIEAAEAREVTILVRSGKAASLRARGSVEAYDADRDLLRINVSEPIEFAREVAGYGADAVVLAPADIREGVIARLQRAAKVADDA